MKTVLFSVFALVLMFATDALAHGKRGHRGCVEGQTELILEQDQFGDDHYVTRTCTNGTFYPELAGKTVTHRGCREGQTELMLETDQWGNDHYVIRTCRNGAFARSTKSVKHVGCREGQTETWLIDRGDDSRLETYVCTNGAFRRAY